MEQQVKEILWQIKGNSDLGIEGLRPQLSRIERDVSELKDWRTIERERKASLKRTFSAIGIAIGGIGTIIAIFEGLKQIFS